MSTRATLTVTDREDSFDIYRHHDGYPHSPHGVIHDIDEARKLAWPWPRFQADDYAAALIATMKKGAGSVYLTKKAADHADRVYHYDITKGERELQVKVLEYSSRVQDVVPIWEGALSEAIEKFDATVEID